ncbi:hypothetical protein SAMN02745165_00564 [Malonomonas rubra DSM 5091]|uniref:Uncharacterized protein n=1 Tax=Malonomonas rubra DSM 5091 TaxID=1122189 RepID=A0A1M6CL88_MALRU|nr:hypothetical protein [Malonomonas rubra]SHI61776.1 hypothetical protein SAMN02745165_00564 [Malonomonas rubra DSM 5091]
MKIPAEVAKIMSKWGGHSVRLAAARGALPMSGPNLVTVLFIFYHGDNEELKKESLSTLKTLPAQILLSALENRDLHFSIIDLIARCRFRDSAVMEKVLSHPMTGLRTYLFVAKKSSGDVLDMLSHNDRLLAKAADLRQAIIDNPHADKVMKLRLGWVEPEAEPEPAPKPEPKAKEEAKEGENEEEGDEEEDKEDLSKYQQLQEMVVAEKIKMALTGDKEWRTLLIRESNKLVSSAVLKNPRITDGEVLAVAKSRTSSEELIRIILLNKDWVKLYDMKKALVEHPRTPVQKAMRFMNFLSEKDIRELSKSRNVSQVIVNNARRMLMSKKR